MFKFEKLEVWNKAVALYQNVSELTDFINQREQFSLGEPARRAALSISSNIAEGTGRERDKEAKYFFNIAKGSVYEVVSLPYVMKEKSYLQAQEHKALCERCDEIAKMLSGLLGG